MRETNKMPASASFSQSNRDAQAPWKEEGTEAGWEKAGGFRAWELPMGFGMGRVVSSKQESEADTLRK